MMTLEELQREVVALNEEERNRLSFFLKHIRRVDTEENKAEFSRLHRSIDKGDYVTLEQWQDELRATSSKEG